jgi:hypothetical protein
MPSERFVRERTLRRPAMRKLRQNRKKCPIARSRISLLSTRKLMPVKTSRLVPAYAGKVQGRRLDFFGRRGNSWILVLISVDMRVLRFA